MARKNSRAHLVSDIKRLARKQGRILIRKIVPGVGGTGWLLDGREFASALEVKAELTK